MAKKTPTAGRTTDLVWSKKLPRTPGYYWARHPGFMYPEVVYVARCLKTRVVVQLWGRMVDAYYADPKLQRKAEWAGPIPFPSEPSKTNERDDHTAGDDAARLLYGAGAENS